MKQYAVKFVGRQRLEVMCVSHVRAAIEPSVEGLDIAKVLELLQMGRTLEHEVFEQMGKAGATLRFGPHADVVEHGDADDRGGAVRSDDDTQSVRQRMVSQS